MPRPKLRVGTVLARFEGREYNEDETFVGWQTGLVCWDENDPANVEATSSLVQHACIWWMHEVIDGEPRDEVIPALERRLNAQDRDLRRGSPLALATRSLKDALLNVRHLARLQVDMDRRRGPRYVKQPLPEMKVSTAEFRVPRDTLEEDLKAVIQDGEARGLSPYETLGLLAVKLQKQR